MRLLVLTTSFPSAAYPASGIYIQRMLKKLPKDVQATVLSPACDQPPGPPWGAQPIQVKQFRYAPYPLQILAHRPGGIPAAVRQQPWAWASVPLFSAAMFFSVLRHARGADLIHAQWSFSGLIAGLAGKLTGIPSITTLHGSDVRWSVKNRFLKNVLKWCARLNTRVVTVGQDLADQVRQWVPPDQKRIKVIPNGVDETFWSDRGKFTSRHTVMVIGNLIALKQVDLVIRAFESLVDMDERLRLVIIGAGPEMSQLQSLARSFPLGGRVRFMGQLPPDEVAEQLAQSAMLVLASTSEGRPSVILEAMAARVPVVASNIGGVRELIVNGERGLLFPVGDVARLASCMKTLVVDPDYGRQLAANAFQWIHDHRLTWEQTAQSYAQLYREVVAEYRHKSG